MKIHTHATLLGVLLVPAFGVGHCPAGDARVFESPCLRAISSNSPARRPPAKMVSWEYTASEMNGFVRQRLDVTACSTSLARATDGVTELLGPLPIEPADARALHDALVDAGALDAESVPVVFAECGFALGAPMTSSDVTVYEPSLVPGGAWSNSFRFGFCASTPHTSAVEAALHAWVETHFDR